MKAVPVTANSLLIAQRLHKGLPQRYAAVFHRVMRIDFQISIATEGQIHDGMFRKQREHVVKKRDARFDGRLSPPVNVQLEADAGFFGDTLDSGLPWFHGGN